MDAKILGQAIRQLVTDTTVSIETSRLFTLVGIAWIRTIQISKGKQHIAVKPLRIILSMTLANTNLLVENHRLLNRETRSKPKIEEFFRKLLFFIEFPKKVW